MRTALDFPLGGRSPAAGETLEVSPGVHWLRMPLPSSLKHVNLWLLDEGDGWTIVDCGIAAETTKQLWRRVLAAAARGKPVRRVIVTHMHSDHLGLAQWLCETQGARLWMSAADYRWAQRMLGATGEAFGAKAAAYLLRHGVEPGSLIDLARTQPSPYPALVPGLPPLYRAIADGQEVDIGGRTWRALAAEGHTPEHLSFYCASLDLMIAGDMLLPSISPYVGVPATTPEANPLPGFLRSLDRFLALSDRTLVLPSHGNPFRGIASRVAELHRHHRDRLADVRNHCAVPRSAAELVPLVFRQALDDRQCMLAIAEIIAHANALESMGQLRRQEGAHGVVRFAAD